MLIYPLKHTQLSKMLAYGRIFLSFHHEIINPFLDIC